MDWALPGNPDWATGNNIKSSFLLGHFSSLKKCSPFPVYIDWT